MNKNILFSTSAFKIVLDYLKSKGYKWKQVNHINLSRYAIVIGEPNVAILFKKEWYLSFGDKAKECNWVIDSHLQSGIGDTINKEDLRTMLQHDVKTIYTLHKSGAIYSIPMPDFILNSFSWTNKESKEVRSISIHRYHRENNEDDKQ